MALTCLHSVTNPLVCLQCLQSQLSVKGITSTSYFSTHFKNTTFGVMERKFLCSGDVLDIADLTDKTK